MEFAGTVTGYSVVSSKINNFKLNSYNPSLKSNLSIDGCPIAAIEYQGFSPNKIINLISKENTIFENTEEFFTTETLLKDQATSTFPLTHYAFNTELSGKIDYLITDYVTEKQNTPLFYQYEMLFDCVASEDSSVVSVYKNNEILVKPDSYLLQFSYDLVSSSGRYSSTSWGQINYSEDAHRVRILLPITFSNSSDFYVISYKKNIYSAITDQRELIDIVPLYSGSEFTINSQGVKLTSISDIEKLYIVKDPKDKIAPIGIAPFSHQLDNVSSWNLAFNPGAISIASGEFTGSSELGYYVTNKYSTGPIAMASIRPSFISDNILKVDYYPIYLDSSSYVFPNYVINTYDRSSTATTTNFGDIAISVNGKYVPELKITSIDRNKGFIQLNKILNNIDEIELDFFVNNSDFIIVRNLELNPKLTSSALFNISGYKDDGLGIALRPYNSLDPNTELLYIYDLNTDEDTRICYSIPQVGDSTTSVYWSGEAFFTMCELNLNRLTPDNIKITDARRVAGVDYSALNKYSLRFNPSGLNLHEFDWYTDRGFYDGEPLAFGGTFVIHIPSGVFYSARNQWISSIESTGVDAQEATENGTKEFNFYLDQVIKRYISAGTNYVLIPVDSSGNFMDIVRLDY
jgi:hypothetical protein